MNTSILTEADVLPLGAWVRDRESGCTGVIVALILDPVGTLRYLVQPHGVADVECAEWCDARDLDVVRTPVM